MRSRVQPWPCCGPVRRAGFAAFALVALVFAVRLLVCSEPLLDHLAERDAADPRLLRSSAYVPHERRRQAAPPPPRADDQAATVDRNYTTADGAAAVRHLRRVRTIVSVAAFEAPEHVLLLVENCMNTTSDVSALNVVVHLNRDNYIGRPYEWPSQWQLVAARSNGRPRWTRTVELGADASWQRLRQLHEAGVVTINCAWRERVTRGSTELLFAHLANFRSAAARVRAAHRGGTGGAADAHASSAIRSVACVFMASNMLWMRSGWDVYAALHTCSLLRHGANVLRSPKHQPSPCFRDPLFARTMGAFMSDAYVLTESLHEGTFYSLAIVEAFTEFLVQQNAIHFPDAVAVRAAAARSAPEPLLVDSSWRFDIMPHCGAEERFIYTWLVTYGIHFWNCSGHAMASLIQPAPTLAKAYRCIDALAKIARTRPPPPYPDAPMFAWKWIDRDLSEVTMYVADTHRRDVLAALAAAPPPAGERFTPLCRYVTDVSDRNVSWIDIPAQHQRELFGYYGIRFSPRIPMRELALPDPRLKPWHMHALLNSTALLASVASALPLDRHVVWSSNASFDIDA